MSVYYYCLSDYKTIRQLKCHTWFAVSLNIHHYMNIVVMVVRNLSVAQRYLQAYKV